MSATVPAGARIVIIGGGIIGCSIAYHLAKRGIRDVVLLERLQLTHGATWHAAGLVGQLRSSSNLTRLMRYGAETPSTLVGVHEPDAGELRDLLRQRDLAVRDHTTFKPHPAAPLAQPAETPPASHTPRRSPSTAATATSRP